MTRWPSLTALLAVGAIIRAIFIAYGVYRDAHHALKYTDVDYKVFSDAARFVYNASNETRANGPLGKYLSVGDPYARATYRYTPLLALLLLPNEFVHPLFGKVLFASCDILITYLLYLLLTSPLRRMIQNKAKTIISCIWLFNPIAINISTRGSSEAILGVMVLACLLAFERRRYTLSAVLLGLCVHFKIYPVIYAVSLVSALADHTSVYGFFVSLFSRRILGFAAVSLASFVGLNAIMYAM